MTAPNSCPDPAELAMWLDRELGERRAERVAAHVAICSVCRARTDALRQLIADVAAPAVAPAGDRAVRGVRAVMMRLDEPARAPARSWWTFGASGLILAAAALALVLRHAPDDAGAFTPRGLGSGSSLARDVGTTLYTLAPRAQPVVGDAVVHADAAFTLGYRNLSATRATWALVFAVDAAGDTHWLYPGYTSAADDPGAVALPATEHEQLMPDSVILDHPARGPLRVITIVSPTRLHVSAIERLHGAELTVAALRQRFPDAVIGERAIEIAP